MANTPDLELERIKRVAEAICRSLFGEDPADVRAGRKAFETPPWEDIEKAAAAAVEAYRAAARQTQRRPER